MRVALRASTVTAVFLAGILLSCQGVSTLGNLIGVVAYEGSGGVVSNPVVLIGPAVGSAGSSEQVIVGDDKGRFAVTLDEGSYLVRVGLSRTGPFYEHEKPVWVPRHGTAVIALTIPKDFAVQ